MYSCSGSSAGFSIGHSSGDGSESSFSEEDNEDDDDIGDEAEPGETHLHLLGMHTITFSLSGTGVAVTPVACTGTIDTSASTSRKDGFP